MILAKDMLRVHFRLIQFPLNQKAEAKPMAGLIRESSQGRTAMGGLEAAALEKLVAFGFRLMAQGSMFSPGETLASGSFSEPIIHELVLS
jgi:hypothetical protein